MRKVLIVDDEKLIRKGIKTILERSDLEFKDIKEATNGEEALKLLSSEHFDVLIIDIRLPVIDGISVIKKVQNFTSKPKIIVISGYDEFNYAKECLQCGVKDYILKPIDKTELLNVLKEIDEEIRKEEQAGHIFKMHEYLKSRMIESELSNIILSNPSIHEVKRRLENIGLPPEKEIFLIVFDNIKNIFDLSLPDIREGIRENLKDEYNFIIFPDFKRSIIMLCDNLPDCKLFSLLTEETNCKISYIGICDCKIPLTELRNAYSKAIKTAEYGFVTNKKVEFYSNIKNRENNFIDNHELIQKLKGLILADKKEEALKCIDLIYSSNFLTKGSIESIKTTANEICKEIINYYYNYLPNESSKIGQYDLLNDLFSFKNIFDYLTTLKNFICEVIEIIRSLKCTLVVKDEINKAIEYIRENYDKDINMAMVANHVSLNYYYFSAIFKEKTGMNFLDFLNKIRVEKAKELLLNTNFKVWEISEKVGYKNPKHFTRVFKELTGLLPHEYRNTKIFNNKNLYVIIKNIKS